MIELKTIKTYVSITGYYCVQFYISKNSKFNPNISKTIQIDDEIIYYVSENGLRLCSQKLLMYTGDLLFIPKANENTLAVTLKDYIKIREAIKEYNQNYKKFFQKKFITT